MDNRDRGFSLIEVMIAMGIAVVVSLGILEMIGNQNKAVRGVENQSENAQLQNLLAQIISNSAACTKLFTGIQFNSLPPPVTYPSTSTYPITLGTTGFPINWRWNSRTSTVPFGQYLQIPPFQINAISMVTGSSPPVITGNLLISPSPVGNINLGAPIPPINIGFVANLSPSAPYTILSCGANSQSGGRVSCPAGYTLAGASGTNGAYCISSTAAPKDTELAAYQTCVNALDSTGNHLYAHLCTSSEWSTACIQEGGALGMPPVQEWVFLPHLYDNGNHSLAGNFGTLMGGLTGGSPSDSCIGFDQYETGINGLHPFRCCFN